MDDATAPPPTPERVAHASKVLNEQAVSDNTMAVITMGMHSKMELE